MPFACDQFQLLDDEPNQNTVHSALFPNDFELQEFYDNIFAVNAELREARARGESGFQLRHYGKVTPLKETIITTSALATAEAKQAELLDDIARLKSDIEQNDRLINDSQQFIEGANTQYTEAIVSGDLDSIDDIETQTEKWETNIKRLKLRNLVIEKAITQIGDVGKIIGRMVDRIKGSLISREIEAAKKEYDKHLNQFAEHFKAYHEIFVKGYDMSNHQRGTILSHIEESIYAKNGYAY